LLALLLIPVWWKVGVWRRPVLQQLYLKTYVQTVWDQLPSPKKKSKTKPYSLVVAGAVEHPILLTDRTLKSHWTEARVQRLSVEPIRVQRWLEKQIYGGDITRTLWLFAGLSMVSFIVLAGVGAELDRRRQRGGQWGVHVRGTRMVTWRRFNREAPKGKPGIVLRCGKRSWQKIRIAEELLAYHFGLFAATGRGKSSVIRQWLHQIQARGETAVIFDPKGEFRDEFYSADRKDVIYDPTDKRCPYHEFESEAEDEAQATPWASAFWPPVRESTEFFRKNAKGIFALLMARYSPTAATLGYWIAHPEKEIEPRLRDTEFAVATDPKAPAQAAGIYATLGEVSKALRMMPKTPEDGCGKFSVREFAKTRRGWIFMTSDPLTAEAVLPLQSAVMDLLILSTQAPPKPGEKLPRVWFILDEIASMQKLPQLQSGMTKQRASGNVLVLGIHDMAQLKERYGDNGAVTVTSQAATNIILQTESDKAAAEMAGLIGKEEIERMTENRPVHIDARHRSRSWSNQTVESHPVMGSQVQGVPLFQGWLKQQGKLVRINIQPLARVAKTERMERLIPKLSFRPPPEEGAAGCAVVPVDDVPPKPYRDSGKKPTRRHVLAPAGRAQLSLGAE
jgi:type IV secretory pathway TraG/TraD family ATPase VirD4